MDLGELVDQIHRFPQLDRSEQYALIDKLVAIHPTLNVHWGPGWRFRRSRILESNEIPQTVDDVIWRKNAPARLGRANAEGFRVLYLADRRDTSLREVDVSREWVAIAEFEIRPEHAIFVCPIGELFQIVRTGRGFLSGDASNALSKMLNACPLHESRSLVITDAFLYELMTGHDEYEISSYVSGAIFKKLKQVSAIAYTSRRQLGAINLAVRVDSFWQDWGLRSVRRAYAEQLALGFYKLSKVTGALGVFNSGKFEWKKDSGHEEAVHLLSPLYYPDNG
jgi:hypothetical protein